MHKSLLQALGACLLLTGTAGVASAQSRMGVTVLGGMAVSDNHPDGGPETGPALGVRLSHRVASRWSVEAIAGLSVFGVSEVIPTCLPENVDQCHARIISPGQLASGLLALRASVTPALDLRLGAGATRSTSFPDELTSSHKSSLTLHGGASLHPFGSGGRGIGLELGVMRFTRNIGSLGWVFSPGVSWTF